MAKPHIVVLGGNFAGLTTARLIRQHCKDAVDITVIDRKSFLLFVPNIGIEVFANRDPSSSMHLELPPVLARDGTEFIQADVVDLDVDKKQVTILPNERPGASLENVSYDYLVVALGARLAYDKIEGFGEFGSTVSDSYYGNRLRRYLHEGHYRGGPIAIGSARFQQGTEGKPDWLPTTHAACDGPPLELALSLHHWMERHMPGSSGSITLFSAADLIAEDAGEEIVNQFLDMASEMGIQYERDTPDVQRLTADGIEFTNGKSLDAELKIVLPNWEPHGFLRDLPITDEVGFVITESSMRNDKYPNVYAVGDAAALTVPKLGALGHKQAEVVAFEIARELGQVDREKPPMLFQPEVICFGDMGGHRAFYIHSDTWFGGQTSVLKMGFAFYAMKIGFKEMYYRSGGKVPSWGMPLTELLGDRIL